MRVTGDILIHLIATALPDEDATKGTWKSLRRVRRRRSQPANEAAE
jgi:hypothetical protein